MKTLEASAETFCEDYIQGDSSLRFVLGTGEYARSLGNAIPIRAYVDDFTSDKYCNGVPIIRLSDVPVDGLVVVASMLRPRTALQAVRGLGLRSLDYFAFERFSELPILPVAFWPQFAAEYKCHSADYAKLRDRLADQASVDLYDNLIQFRINSDLQAMAAYQFDPLNQYFEPFLDLRENGETFVDVGSFDGRTSLEFAARAPNFEHIYAFEPSPKNIRQIEENLAVLGENKFTLFPFGLADREGQIDFNSNLGSSSRASNSGDTQVTIRPLDALKLKNPTMIKMDIEGGETHALFGGINTIRKYRPRLAISVYHRYDDLRLIPHIVGETGVPYKVYLRHYTEGIDETVMFFIPEDRDCQ